MAEDLVPFDRGRHWQRHDDYFAGRGVAAWTQGEIPSLSTNNRAFARQVAALILAHAGDRESVDVLEIGGGLGTFAANFLAALDDDLGDAGRALAARLRYAFSDYSEATLRQATAGPELADAVAAGRVRPMLCDVRAPGRIRPLDGGPPPARFVAVIANYVACVLPAKHLQKRGDAWWQLGIRAGDPDSGVPSELEWMPVALETAFTDPLHARIAASAVDGLDEATVSVPHAFLDFHRAAGELLDDAGVLVVNDFGNVEREQLRGLRDLTPRSYGGSVNQDVCFAVFDSYAAEVGATVLRTRDPLRAVHSLVLARAPLPAGTSQVFEEQFVRAHASQDLLDLVAAARLFLERGEHARAIRFLGRAIRLDPGNPELYLLRGTAAIEAGLGHAARDVLARGRALDRWQRYDFDFELGRAHTAAGELDQAIACYQASLARVEHPTTYSNLGSLHEEQGDFPEALIAFHRARALDPGHARATERLAALKERWWDETVASVLRGDRAE